MFLINPLPLLQWNFVMRSIVIFMVQHRHLFRIRMLKHICKCRLTRPDSLCNTSYRSFHSFHLCILFSQRLNALGHAEMGIRADSYNQPQLILLIYILYKTAVNPDWTCHGPRPAPTHHPECCHSGWRWCLAACLKSFQIVHDFAAK